MFRILTLSESVKKFTVFNVKSTSHNVFFSHNVNSTAPVCYQIKTLHLHYEWLIWHDKWFNIQHFQKGLKF